MSMPKKPRRKCPACGKECKRPQDFYCNNRCQRDYEWSQRKRDIEKKGIIDGGVHVGKTAKRYLLEMKGHQCSICRGKKWMGEPIPLVLDHIDGHADNWSLENIRLVCGNCDMQLPTYKSKNKGNGRHWRKQRYRDGKSY